MTIQRLNPNILNTFEEAIDLLNKKLRVLGNPPLVWVGQRGSDALMFDGIVKFDTIVCLDYGEEVSKLEESASVFSLEKIEGYRGVWYSGQIPLIFENPELKNKLNKHLPKNSKIIAYASKPDLELLAHLNSWDILSPISALRSYFENKIEAANILEKIGLPTVPSLISTVKSISYEEAAEKIGFHKMVIQLASGSSGEGTYFAADKKEFKEILKNLGQETVVKISKFIDGPSIAVNGVITDHEVLMGTPSLQIVGNPETAVGKGTYSGNDFCAELPEEKFTRATRVCKAIGEYMHYTGYRGWVNFDLLSNGSFLVDINPRFSGSANLFTRIQIDNNEIPLALLHLLQWLGVNFVLSDDAKEKISRKKDGCMIVLHSLENEDKKVHGEVKAGIYSFVNNRLEFLRPGTHINNLKKDSSEVLITGGIPRQGMVVKPTAPMCRVYTWKQVVGPNLELSEFGRSLAKALYQMLELR